MALEALINREVFAREAEVIVGERAELSSFIRDERKPLLSKKISGEIRADI